MTTRSVLWSDTYSMVEDCREQLDHCSCADLYAPFPALPLARTRTHQNNPFAPVPPGPAPGPGPSPGPGPGPSPAVCKPAGAHVTAGQALGLQTCDGSAGQQWLLDTTGAATPIKSSAPGDICIGLDSGRGLRTMACGNTSSEMWTYEESEKRITEAGDGKKCFDITWCGGAVCSGMLVDVYSCNGAHQNQEFTAENNTLVAEGVGSRCLGVCAAGERAPRKIPDLQRRE